jgi:hypothetical protein
VNSNVAWKKKKKKGGVSQPQRKTEKRV